MPKAKPPTLPADAPQDVKDFVDCKSDSITLDPTKKGFLPEIPVIGAPNVTLDAVAGKPGTIKVTLKKAGLLDTSFTITVKDGHLDADTTGVTPQMVKDALDKWLKRYNAWLDANNRKLDGITVDKGKATITKVALGGAGKAADGGTGGGGVKKAVGVGVGALILGTGSYLGYQALDSDSGDSGGSGGSGTSDTSVSSDPSAPASEVAVGTDPVVYTCDTVANCGPTHDALIQVVGVAITHDGSPEAPDAPSDAEVVGVTTWDDSIELVAECAFGETTGQAMPDGQGVFRIHLPLYQFGPCEIAGMKLKDAVKFSDGILVEAVGLAPFEITAEQTEIDEAALQQLIDDFALLDTAGATDAKVVADVLAGTDVCFVDTLLPDAEVRDGVVVLCGPEQPAYGLSFAIPGPIAAGAVEISGVDQATVDALFGPGGTLQCGVGDIAITICPEGEFDAAIDYATLFQALIPAQDVNNPLTFHLGDGTTVSVTPDGADPTVDVSGDLHPYVLIRNQAMSVFVPGYRADAFNVADSPDLTPWPPISYGGQPGSTPQSGERQVVERFATQLAQSLASDDKGFALDHLDPAVLQVFPTECPAHFAALDDPTYAIKVLGLGPTGSYDYAPPSAGGRSVVVDEVMIVDAKVTDTGDTHRARLHFGVRGGDLSWFADCGASP